MSAGPPAAGRLIVGNLDCESDFAALAGSRVGPLPRRVLSAIAGAGTLLRAFARDDGDRLWLPAHLARRAMADVPGLPRPVLESGPLPALEPAAEILAWGVTPAVAKMSSPLWKRGDRGGILRPVEIPWNLPLPSPDAAAKVNDRRFGLELAEALGCRLPAARAIASIGDLDDHLESSGVESWVLKAPFSAAGRWRVIHLGGSVTPTLKRRVARLFARHKELVFEPWMERTLDVGCAAAITEDGLVELSLHRLLVDRAGRFRGIELIADADGLEGPWLTAPERARMAEVLDGVGDALTTAGFSGTFGVDAWRYVQPDGAAAFHPLGEINGRLTFGWVARALVERLREPLGIEPGRRVRLTFARSRDDRQIRAVPLLTALKPGDPECRLELLRS